MSSTLRSLSFGKFNGKNTFEQECGVLSPAFQDEHTQYDYAYEALTGALNKPETYCATTFNPIGFAHKCKENHTKSAEKDRSKTVNLCDDTDTEIAPRNGDITVDKASLDTLDSRDASKVTVDSYEEFENKEELESVVLTIRRLNEKIISDYNIDLVALIHNALLGLHPAMEKLKAVYKQFKEDADLKEVAELIKVIFEPSNRDAVTL